MLHSAIFFTNASLVAALVEGAQCDSVVRKCLLPVLGDFRKIVKFKRQTFSFPDLSKISNFLIEHNALSNLVMLGNRQLWGRVMASFLLTNIPINVYGLSIIILSSRNLTEQFVLLILLLIQLFAFVVSMWPLSYTSARLHAPQNKLVALQPYLTGYRWILLKLKLDDLKCRLSCGRPRVAVTIGPARDVTNDVLLEVILVSIF